MSSSMGRIIQNMKWKIKAMFETTNQTIFVGISDFVLFLRGDSSISAVYIISKRIYLFGPAIELNGNEMEIFPNKDAVLLINNLLRNGQFTNKMGSLMRLFINKTVIHLTLYIPCRDPGIGPVLQPRDVWPQLIQYPTISLLTSILGCSHPILGHCSQMFLVRRMSQPYPRVLLVKCIAQEINQKKAPVHCGLQQCRSISSSGLQAFQAWPKRSGSSSF